MAVGSGNFADATPVYAAAAGGVEKTINAATDGNGFAAGSQYISNFTKQQVYQTKISEVENYYFLFTNYLGTILRSEHTTAVPSHQILYRASSSYQPFQPHQPTCTFNKLKKMF